MIAINERLRCVRIKLDESYKTAKRALIQLHGNYNDSKTASVLRRYAILKAMIKVNIFNARPLNIIWLHSGLNPGCVYSVVFYNTNCGAKSALIDSCLCRTQEVVRLETQYWLLVELPKQEKQEPVPAYVLRACATLEKTQKPGEGVKTSAKLAEEDEKRRERLDRLECMYCSAFILK